ncbi:MAG TPA: cupin domain-containing protein [Noviherbaspirillum sp.]|nr:cupin domain-containing protein [Noviherbaspirillum sp.]
MLTNLKEAAANLPFSWKSSVVGHTGGANLKVLRMDECSYAAEAHEYVEALIVLEGCMNLSIEDQVVKVQAGEMYLVPSGLQHGVAAGSYGTLLIVDPSNGR